MRILRAALVVVPAVALLGGVAGVADAGEKGRPRGSSRAGTGTSRRWALTPIPPKSASTTNRASRRDLELRSRRSSRRLLRSRAMPSTPTPGRRDPGRLPAVREERRLQRDLRTTSAPETVAGSATTAASSRRSRSRRGGSTATPKLAGKPDDLQFNLAFDVPVAASTRRTALPAGGGESGKALRRPATSRWSPGTTSTTRPFFTERSRPATPSTPTRSAVVPQGSSRQSYKIVRGFVRGDRALLLVEGETSYSKVKTEAQIGAREGHLAPRFRSPADQDLGGVRPAVMTAGLRAVPGGDAAQAFADRDLRARSRAAGRPSRRRRR